MSPLRSGFGEQIQFGSLGSGQGAVPSSAIGGLSSRQVVFGSPSGGVDQNAFFQFDSTNGRVGVGSSAPTARFTAIPPDVTTAFSYDWYTSAGVHSGVINSAGFLGLLTTAPGTPLHVNGDALVVGKGRYTNSVDINSTAAGLVALQVVTTRGGSPSSAGDAGIWLSSQRGTTLNDGIGIGYSSALGGKWIQTYSGHLWLNPVGNNVGVGTTNPAAVFDAHKGVRLMSTGANVAFSAFGVAGTTQASSYTTGSASTGRVLPSTITTVAGLMSAAERENFNRGVQALETIFKDLAGYGWLR